MEIQPLFPIYEVIIGTVVHAPSAHPVTHENVIYWERGRPRPQDLADTESFPKQESMCRFRGIVVDSAVFEYDGGRGRPRSQ
jgi:hypothetical protein